MRCLIVEDDYVAQQVMGMLLADYAECTLAPDGYEAVEFFRMALDEGRPYDLICLDIMMPSQDGHETLKQIRQIEKEREILGGDGVKVIMTTALTDTTSISTAFQEGCESYLIKPIRRDTFFQEMKKLGLVLQKSP